MDKEYEFSGIIRRMDEDGYTYHGGWRNGKKEGRGKQTLVAGTSYDGEWKENWQHGQGRYTMENGDYHEGKWHGGSESGKHTYYNSKNKKIQTIDHKTGKISKAGCNVQ